MSTLYFYFFWIKVDKSKKIYPEKLRWIKSRWMNLCQPWIHPSTGRVLIPVLSWIKPHKSVEEREREKWIFPLPKRLRRVLGTIEGFISRKYWSSVTQRLVVTLLLLMHFGCFWHRQGCQGALGKQMEKLYDVQLFTASTSSLADAGCWVTWSQNHYIIFNNLKHNLCSF